MLRYGIALAAVMVSTTALAQDSHSLDLQIESSLGVAISGGPVLFAWQAPVPGSPYSTTPDGISSTTVALDYTSDGSGGIEVSSDVDFATQWGITVEADASTAVCGIGSSILTVGTLPSTIIDLSGAGSCSDSATVNYSASITDPMVFSAANDAATATITYTMF